MTAEEYLILRKKAFELIKRNSIKRDLSAKKLNEEKDRFDIIRNRYSNVIDNNKKRELEYLFLFEQHNLKRMPYENRINQINLYTNRLEQFIYYINASESKSEIKTKSMSYRFNDAIQKESLSYYDNSIQELKQRVITIKRFNSYMEYLRENDIEEFNNKLDSMSYIEDLNELLDKQSKLEQTKEILKSTFITDKFVMELDNNTKDELMIEPVISVVSKMYPGLDDKLSKLTDDENKKVA